VVRLLLHNAVRVDEACAAGLAGLGEDCGHRVIRVARKGARKVKIPLTAATVAALDAYLADRAHSAGVPGWRQLTGSLLATAGGRLRQVHFWELVRCLARTAGIGAWEQLSPRCLRHLAITCALDAGASLRDVQDYASRKDPAPPAGMITPATAWTATPPIPSPPTWRSSIAELLGSAPAR
jgi:integrase/recombinase XerD